MQVEPSQRQILPLAINSFFAASGCANVAVKWLVCATAAELTESTAAAIKFRFFTCGPCCACLPIY